MELLFLNIGTPEIIILFLAFFITLPVVILQLYCLTIAAKSNHLTSDRRISWILIILFVPVFRYIWYLIWGKNQEIPAETKY
ncbi:Phospholipase_D-nuclease N-terminal [bacterium A37T11]|nr:Phospholipase_D-nuclease N-terminal [bacterium A37T11]